MPPFQPTVHLKCSSVTYRNNEQKQPSKLMGGQGELCMLIFMCGAADKMLLARKYRSSQARVKALFHI